MTLIRYEPWSVLNQLHGQINRLFDAEIDRDASTSAATADWIPQADIEEYTDRFVLKLDVPGVELGRSRNHARQWPALAQRRAGEGRRPARMCSARRVERPHGRFHRRFTLPDTVDAAGVRDWPQRHRRSDDSEAAERHSRAASRSRLPDAVVIGAGRAVTAGRPARFRLRCAAVLAMALCLGRRRRRTTIPVWLPVCG